MDHPSLALEHPIPHQVVLILLPAISGGLLSSDTWTAKTDSQLPPNFILYVSKRISHTINKIKNMLHNFSKSIQKFCAPMEGNANLLGGPSGPSRYRPSCFSSTIIPAAAPKEMQVSRCSLPVPGPRLHYVSKKGRPASGLGAWTVESSCLGSNPAVPSWASY